MTYEQIRALAANVRGVPLESVLHLSGAQRDRGDKHKWHTSQGVLSVTGTKFMNWNSGVGGGGAIDLAIHLLGFGFIDAVQWLAHHFPACQPPQSDWTRESSGGFRPPEADPERLRRVRRYLITERRLPSYVIDPLIDSGTLYADHRANAVFLMRQVSLLVNHTKQPSSKCVGAELRGTTTLAWRGLAAGSQKDFGCFAVGTESVSCQAFILVESAIDAISCAVLNPKHGCLSTAGARPNPIWLRDLVARGLSVFCGYDADSTGDTMAVAMTSLYPGIARLRPPFHDWNDALKAR
jgi:hypothetical protein